jgi:hypothetical protein
MSRATLPIQHDGSDSDRDAAPRVALLAPQRRGAAPASSGNRFTSASSRRECDTLDRTALQPAWPRSRWLVWPQPSIGNEQVTLSAALSSCASVSKRSMVSATTTCSSSPTEVASRSPRSQRPSRPLRNQLPPLVRTHGRPDGASPRPLRGSRFLASEFGVRADPRRFARVGRGLWIGLHLGSDASPRVHPACSVARWLRTGLPHHWSAGSGLGRLSSRRDR